MPPYLEEFKGTVVAGIPVSLKRGPLAIAFDAPLTMGPEESEFTERLEEVCFALARQAEEALAAAPSNKPTAVGV